jgi:hypothetical protein
VVEGEEKGGGAMFDACALALCKYSSEARRGGWRREEEGEGDGDGEPKEGGLAEKVLFM